MEGMEMATSKAIKQADQRRISQVGDFKNRIGGTLELPSGSVVAVRNPGGMQVFMQSKAIPNSLMPIIQKSLVSGQAPDAQEMMSGGDFDPQMLQDMSQLMDYVVMRTFTNPRVYSAPTEADMAKWNAENPTEVFDDIEDYRTHMDEINPKLYIDEIPMDDKQFVFNWVSGGTRDLEQFRIEQERSMGALAASARPAASPE